MSLLSILFNSAINEDLSSDREKYYNDIPEDIFYRLISLDPTYKDGSNVKGKYTQWILRLYKSGNLLQEDEYKVPQYLTEYEKKKKSIADHGINDYKTLPDLAVVLDKTKDVKLSASQLQRQARKEKRNTDLDKDADFIMECAEWYIYIYIYTILKHMRQAVS